MVADLGASSQKTLILIFVCFCGLTEVVEQVSMDQGVQRVCPLVA